MTRIERISDDEIAWELEDGSYGSFLATPEVAFLIGELPRMAEIVCDYLGRAGARDLGLSIRDEADLGELVAIRHATRGLRTTSRP